MKTKLIIAILLVLGIGIGFSSVSAEEHSEIPPWVKGVANFWVQGNITDGEFLEAIEFLINSGTIIVDIEDEYYEDEYYADDEYYEDEYEIGYDDGYDDGYDNGYDDGYGGRYDAEEDYYENDYYPYENESPEKDYNDGYYDNEKYPTDEDFRTYSEVEITQMGNEYWSCYSGSEPISSNCLAYDEKYFVGGINDLVYISAYNVVCNEYCKLSLDIHYDDVDKKLEKFQSEKLHREIFNAYVSVTPQVILDELVYFSITTDDYSGTQTAVTFRDVDNPLKMELSVDPVDAVPNGMIDKQFFISLMIHENAHMFSLNASQSDNDMIYSETNAEMITLMDKKQAACEPNYYTDIAGCMNDDSYLNLFFQDFWVNVYPDYKWTFEFDTDEAFYVYEDKFIEKYKDQFITIYAMSYVEEDFAESFTAFVLLEKPTGNSIVDQKILFFYDFAEIVEMRDFIRSNL